MLPAFPLLVNQTLTENVALSVGTESETVTVNAAAEGVMLPLLVGAGEHDPVQGDTEPAAERAQLHATDDSFARRGSGFDCTGFGNQHDRCGYYRDSGHSILQAVIFWATEPRDVLSDGRHYEH